MKCEGTGNSSFSSSMGAKISVSGPPNGMYLVIGTTGLPETLAERGGGKTVMRLNGRKMLMVLPFAGYLALKKEAGISHIGPVTVDMRRLARIAKMLASASSTGSGDT